MNEHAASRHITVKVITYYGTPHDVNGVPTLDKVEAKKDMSDKQVVNDPFSAGRPGEMLDELLAAFEAEFKCKVSYLEEGSGSLREFEVFEPSWFDFNVAEKVAVSLLEQLTNYIQGSSSGK